MIHVPPSGCTTNANIVNKARAVNAGGGHAYGSIFSILLLLPATAQPKTDESFVVVAEEED